MGIPRAVGIFHLVWYPLMVVIALAGGFERMVGGIPLGIVVAYAVPMTAFALWRRSAAITAWMAQLDMRVLMVLHSARWVGFGTLLVAAYGLTSPVWALSVAIGDMTAAVALTWLAIRGFQRGRLRRAHVRFWNLWGLIDFVHALAMVTLLLPSPLGVLAGTTPASTSAISGTFPFVLIPILVPLLASTHLIVLAQLRRHGDEVVF